MIRLADVIILLLLCQLCLIRYFGANGYDWELFDESSLVACQWIYSSKLLLWCINTNQISPLSVHCVQTNKQTILFVWASTWNNKRIKFLIDKKLASQSYKEHANTEPLENLHNLILHILPIFKWTPCVNSS